MRGGDAQVFGQVIQATAVNPEAVGIFNLKWIDGSRRGARDARRRRRVRRQGLREEATTSTVGSPLDADLAERETVCRSRCKGIFDPPTGGSPFGRGDDLDAGLGQASTTNPQNLFSFVRMKGGETDANKAALEQQLPAFPNAKVQTKQEFIDNQIARPERDPQRPLRAARAVGRSSACSGS